MARNARITAPLLAAVLTGGCIPAQVRYRAIQAPAPDAREALAVLYLVGDAGEVNEERGDVLGHLRRDIDSIARAGDGPPIVVAFLGDNIYERGATEGPSDADLEKLGGQVRALGRSANVRGIFVPGNHDWAKGASLEVGRVAIERQRAWLDRLSDGRDVALVPSDGCPGPVGEELGRAARLVFIDTEWLLRGSEDQCGTVEAFYERLTAELSESEGRGRPIVVLAHHPLASGGPHGGHVAPFQRGPLLYFLATKSGAIRQDLSSTAYRAMLRGISGSIAASGARPLVEAAGHDHTLQVIRMGGAGEPAYQLVSGAGSRSSRSGALAGTRYATDGFGYMRLDFHESGARLVVFARNIEEGPVRAVFACTLSPAAPEGECPPAPLEEGR
jgi:hypothetical protein